MDYAKLNRLDSSNLLEVSPEELVAYVEKLREELTECWDTRRKESSKMMETMQQIAKLMEQEKTVQDLQQTISDNLAAALLASMKLTNIKGEYNHGTEL